MTRAFVDTNFVLDLLLQREPFFSDASSLFSMADNERVILSVSSLTLAKSHYIITKGGLSPVKAKSVISDLKLLLTILPLNDRVLTLALNDQTFSDFEDGIQYFTALENDQDLIISRNLKDFKASQIPVMNSHSFIRSVSGHKRF